MTCEHCEKKTHVIFVLDTSGSMGSCRDDAIGGFNAQLELLKNRQNDLGKTDVSLVLFGLSGPESVSVVKRAVSVDSVEPLTAKTYTPQGWTPMRDGIGAGIALGELLDGHGTDESFLLITITDGQENASKEWTAVQLAERIKKLREEGRWTFQILGANIDFSNVADFGVDKTEFSQFTTRNYQQSTQNLAHSIGGYASSRGAGLTATKGLQVPPSP